MRIAMPRGDIKMVRFLVKNHDGTATNVDFTEIYFTVKRTAKDRLYAIQKKLSTGGITKLGHGDYQIKIEPNDTREMVINNTRFPNYVFDIQLCFEDSIKETFFGTFVLTDEVTHPADE